MYFGHCEIKIIVGFKTHPSPNISGQQVSAQRKSYESADLATSTAKLTVTEAAMGHIT